MPRFGIRSLLVLMAVVAVFLAALGRPSIYWAAPLPVIALVLYVYGVCRAVLLPAERAFWLSFLAGLLAYGAMLIGVRLFFYSFGAFDDSTQRVGEATAWELVHGEVPWLFQFSNVYQPWDFYCFVMWLHFGFAVVLSALVGGVVQRVTRVRE